MSDPTHKSAGTAGARNNGSAEENASQPPPWKHFLWRVEASPWGRVQKELQTKPGEKKARRDVDAADAHKLLTPLIVLRVEA